MGIFDWFFKQNKNEVYSKTNTSRDLNENEQYIVDSIKSWLKSGSLNEDEIHDGISDLIEDDDVDEGFLHSLAKGLLEAKRQEESKWAESTDCDKLDSVFEQLNDSSIVALQNAGFTMDDGLDYVDEALGERGYDGIIGYCFFHGQDLERVVEDMGLLLAFGDLKDTTAGKIKVGKIICSTLKEHNFQFEWNEDPEARINVSMTWQRRTPV